MSHLGVRAAALVDGELGHEARDRALAHLAVCLPCRSEVVAQRALKRRLLGLDDPTPPSLLSSRLLSLPVQSQVAVSAEAHIESGSTGRGRYVAVGVAASVVSLVGGAFLMGATADSAPDLRPSTERFAFERAATVNDVPFGVTGVAGFSTPSFLHP